MLRERGEKKFHGSKTPETIRKSVPVERGKWGKKTPCKTSFGPSDSCVGVLGRQTLSMPKSGILSRKRQRLQVTVSPLVRTRVSVLNRLDALFREGDVEQFNEITKAHLSELCNAAKGGGSEAEQAKRHLLAFSRSSGKKSDKESALLDELPADVKRLFWVVPKVRMAIEGALWRNLAEVRRRQVRHDSPADRLDNLFKDRGIPENDWLDLNDELYG